MPGGDLMDILVAEARIVAMRVPKGPFQRGCMAPQTKFLKGLPEDVAKFYVASIVLALEYLHDHNIVYRDLKPENVFIDQQGYPKLGDFGFAKVLDVGKRTYTFCGTPGYVAPENILAHGYGTSVDWWGLGVVSYVLLTGKQPFTSPKSEDPMVVMRRIVDEDFAVRFPPYVSPAAKDLVLRLLERKPTRRLGALAGRAGDVKRHKWFEGFDWEALAARKMVPALYGHCRKETRRFGVSKERTLAGTLPERPEGAARPFPCFTPDDGEAPHFVAEMFFANQRLIRVGFIPAIYKFQAVAKHLRRKRMAGAADEEDDDEDFVNEQSRGASVDEWLLLDSVRAILLDPMLGNDLVQFCELTARWILNLLQKNAAQGTAAIEVTSLIPESAVRDMCTVLEYLIRQNASELLGGADISAIMNCLTACLRATDAIPSPAVHASIVQCLVTMLSSQFYSAHRRRIPSPAESALVSAVLGTTALQKELLPALMAAYVQADHVVGLDVDKDAYDKFTMRTQIDMLLMELWRDPACARSLDAVAAAASSGGGKDAALFSDFCGAVLNDLIYLLKDSLGRLEDIATLERSMADKQAWEAQPKPERDGKMQFYQSQQRTVSGFLSMALTSLKMLNTLVASRAVQVGFVGEDIAPKSAGAAFHFIDLLIGPRCGDLLVLKNPMQYHFDPNMLLLNMLQFTLRLAEQPSFVAAMAEVPDDEAAVLDRTAVILKEKQLGEYEYRARLEGLVAAVGHCLREKEKQQAGGGSLAAAAGSAELQREAEGASAAAIEEAYKTAVGPLAVGEFDATLPRAYNRHFAAMAETAAGDVSKAAKRISRELRDLNGKMALPIYAGGAILVRHDQERLDKVRALITGPEGTPYEGGCFFFDVYFPSQYPQTPPLLELETTGGGVARFNPNLYADGKVCLSLLGTWHGGSASEKWNPSTSTLWQVLVSIQSQVLVPEPYYNEPAYEGMRGTVEGDSASLKYNAEIWLSNMRFAMSEVIKNPRNGFEQAIVEHFKALRPRLVKRMATWVESAAPLGPAMQARLEKAAAEVRSLLAGL